MSWIATATLFAMMLALGMTLRPMDFRRIATAPAAVLLGMLGQLVLLPVAAFAIARWLQLSPTLAIGLVLIAACPGRRRVERVDAARAGRSRAVDHADVAV